MWFKSIIHRFPFLPIIILALVLRLWGLGLNPVGITNDEVHDLINAKSLAITFHNAPGTVAGIFTKNGICDGDCVFGELGSFILIPWMKFAPLGLIWSKIPFLLAAIGIVYFGGKLFENLTGKKSIGLVTGLLMAINPWAIHFGRTAFENLFTFCFYLAGLYLFTKKKVSFRDLLFGLILFVLGFLSYLGAKPIFPFLIILAVIYRWFFDPQKNKKQLTSILILGISVFVLYCLILPKSMAGARLNETNDSTQSQLITNTVNEERRISLEIPIFRDYLINKISIKLRFYTEKYLEAFSPKNIFFRGDLVANDIFNIPNTGYLYLIDFPFVLLGLFYFFKKNQKKAFWLLSFLAAIPVASVINDVGTTFALRSGLLYPMLTGLAAIGIVSLYSEIKIKKIFLVALIGIYCFSFGYFWIMYNYRLPMRNSSAWFYDERVLIKYLSLLEKENNQQKIVVVSKDPVDILYLYGFYTNKYSNPDFILKMNKAIFSGKYIIDNIETTRQCPKNIDKNTLYFFDKNMECVNEPNNLPRIVDPRDSGAKFFIPENKLCQDLELKKFIYPRKLKEFDVKKMDREQFCKTWIAKPL